MAHDVFISYSSKDKTVADAVCATLESKGIRCWIAPRDVPPGQSWAAVIVDAISESRVFVLVFSDGSNKSSQVIREVGEAVDSGVPIIPLRIEDVEPSHEMRYYIKSIHWLDAMTPPLERHLDRLVDSIGALLTVDRKAEPRVSIPEIEKPVEKELDKPMWFKALMAFAIIVILGGFGGWAIIKILSEDIADSLLPMTATMTEALLETPVMTETSAPTITPIPEPETELLEISFEPNPVSPVWDEDGYWVWWFSYSVYNPNEYQVEINVFGGLNECLSDESACSFSMADFSLWFTGCGPGSSFVPAKGKACDSNWWVRLDYDPGNDVMGRFAIYFRDQEGEVHRSISEEIVLLKPQ